MKTVVIYCSNHGTTENVAGLIAERQKNSSSSVTMISLLKDPSPSVDEYDRVIIGGSIHFGTIQKQVKRFCQQNEKILLEKELGLFLCCMLEEKKDEEFEKAFPEKLRNHSKASGCFGGEFLFNKLNFLEKIIVKNVAKADKEISAIDYSAIDSFLDKLESDHQ